MSSPPEPIALHPVGEPGRIRELVRARPVVAVWFGTLVFSTGPVMVAAASVAGTVFSFWRLWIGAVVMALLAVAHWRRTGIVLHRSGVRWIVAAGAAFGVHQLLFMVALRTTSVVDVTLMNTLAPVVVAVLAVPMFGERPGVAFRLWSLVAIAGGVVVAVVGSAGPQGQPVGMLLAAGNVVFYSLFFVWSKQARNQVETITFLAGMTIVAAVVVGAYALVSGAPVTGIDLHDLAPVSYTHLTLPTIYSV